MPTPAIQTLINDAQQVLNLDSISAVRSVVAVSLANANTGTPLNPNLTTQQLWNEFYQVVTRSKSDIESIIANQLMKFLYAPPAPGGVGANKQVIFNDNGILAGDAGLTYDKATDSLTVLGSLGVGASPTGKLTIGTGVYAAGTLSGTSSLYSTVGQGLVVLADGLVVATRTGGDRFILDTSGNVGIGVVPSAWNSAIKAVQSSRSSIASNGITTWFGSNVYYDSTYTPTYIANEYAGALAYNPAGFGGWSFYTASAGTGTITGFATAKMTLDESGNLSLANGNLVMGTSGKGIDFSATPQPAGATSELLSDYEEGTWTGTLTGTTTNPTTPVTATGRYTKIGRQVSIQIQFTNVDTTGASGQIKVTGAPFINNSSVSAIGPVLLSAIGTFTGSPAAFIGVNTTEIELYASSSGGGAGFVTHNAGATRSLYINLTYTV